VFLFLFGFVSWLYCLLFLLFSCAVALDFAFFSFPAVDFVISFIGSRVGVLIGSDAPHLTPFALMDRPVCDCV
jgi:hypothetical protein